MCVTLFLFTFAGIDHLFFGHVAGFFSLFFLCYNIFKDNFSFFGPRSIQYNGDPVSPLLGFYSIIVAIQHPLSNLEWSPIQVLTVSHFSVLTGTGVPILVVVVVPMDNLQSDRLQVGFASTNESRSYSKDVRYTC